MRFAAVVLAALAAACATAPPPSSPAPLPAPAPAPTSSEAPDPVPAGPPPVVYAVRFLPGPQWVKGKPAQAQPGIQAHIANMDDWDSRGIVMCGGPFLDGTGGMAVLRVATIEEAKKLAESDPGAVAGLLVPEVHPWLLVMAPPGK